MSVQVDKGYAAVRVTGGWVGVASGTRWCLKVRKSCAVALRDAQRLEEGL